MSIDRSKHDVGRVPMRQAYEWTCESCGRDSFERCVVQELTPDERRELERHNGIEPNELLKVDLVSYPDEVTCHHCGATFGTENDDAEIEGDE